jgi:hypothetical protein
MKKAAINAAIILGVDSMSQLLDKEKSRQLTELTG